MILDLYVGHPVLPEDVQDFAEATHEKGVQLIFLFCVCHHVSLQYRLVVYVKAHGAGTIELHGSLHVFMSFATLFLELLKKECLL